MSPGRWRASARADSTCSAKVVLYLRFLVLRFVVLTDLWARPRIFFCGDRVCERRALDARARGACDPIDFNIFYHRMIELLEKEEDICLDQPTRRTGPDEA